MPIVNPALIQDQLSNELFPQPFVGEIFLLRRDGVSIEVRSTLHGKMSGSGSFFLTNMRIVFHCSSKHNPKDFIGYQADLAEITNPSFEQPIFGANYLKIEARPRHLGDPGDTFRITFNKGGAGTFLTILNELMTQVSRSSIVTTSHPNQPPIAAVYTPTNIGYIDPSDPSIVYVQQPMVASAPPAE